MGFWTAVIIIVAITAGASMVTAITSAIRPKMKAKELGKIKAEIKRELIGGEGTGSLGSLDLGSRLKNLEDRLEIQEKEIEQLNEENSFLRRLLDKDEPGKG